MHHLSLVLADGIVRSDGSRHAMLEMLWQSLSLHINICLLASEFILRRGIKYLGDIVTFQPFKVVVDNADTANVLSIR